jgi:CRISPR-associated protein Cmr1
VPDLLISVRLKTLTPLWTGDTRRNSAIAQESGILGSLRFWYEGILRGAGVYACDPVEGHCPDRHPCQACLLFGSTGRARAFRLEIDGLHDIPLSLRVSTNTSQQTRDWLKSTFCWDNKTKIMRNGIRMLWGPEFSIVVRVSARAEDPDHVRSLLLYTLLTAATEGGIGAKTQNGFGQVRLLTIDGARPDEGRIRERGRRIVNAMPTVDLDQAKKTKDLFSLAPGKFFSFEWEIPHAPYTTSGPNDVPEPGPELEGFCRPCAFEIRYKNPAGQGLFPALRDAFGLEKTKAILGSTTSASRVHVSHLYSETAPHWKLKVWGDVPEAQAIRTAIEGRFPHATLLRKFEAP